MKLVFKKIENNDEAISVEFGNNQKLEFNLNDSNKINNDQIILFLTNIAKEITANNFNYKKDIIELKGDLGKIKDLYDFIYNLFINFIEKFNAEINSYKKELDEIQHTLANRIKESIE